MATEKEYGVDIEKRDVEGRICARGSFKGFTKDRAYRTGQTLSLVILWITMGLYGGLMSLALPDLRDRMRTTVESMSLATGAKRIGKLVGALGGGILHDRFQGRSNAFLAVALMLAGTSIVIQPHVRFVEALGCVIFFEGIAQGSIDAVGNSFVMKLWGEKADPAMHAIHFGYTLGNVFTPLMVRPYLSPDVDSQDGSNHSDVTMTTTFTDSVTTPGTFVDMSRIEVPYFIAGFVTIGMSALFWVLYLVGPPKGFQLEASRKKTWKEVFNPGSCARGHVWYGVTLVVCLVVWTMASNGVTSPYGLAFTYATDPNGPLRMSKDEGTWYDFTRQMAGMAGRLMGIIVTPFVSIKILLLIEVIVICGASLVVGFVGINNQMIFWVFSALTAFMTNPAHPGLYSFIDKYIILFSLVVAMSMIGSGLIGFLFTWANGYIYDNVDKQGIFYLSAASGILLLVIQIVMQAIASVYGPRHKVTSEVIEVTDVNGVKSVKENTDDFLPDQPEKVNKEP